MAKTESTAVNDLIQIAATQKPLPGDPADDLMFSIPSKKDRSSKLSARGTAAVAPLPLPRERAPHGTQEHAVAPPRTITPPPSPPRMSRSLAVAPPPPPAVARTKTPPPLPTSSVAIVAPPIDIPIDVVGAEPAFEISVEPAVVEPSAPRASRPSLPPPTRQALPPTPRPALPSEYPIVSAVHAQPMAPAPIPLAVEAGIPFHGDSTAQVVRPRTTLDWLRKLAPVAGAMVILGVAVGAYIAHENRSTSQAAAAPAVASEVAPVVVLAPMVEPPAEPPAAPPAIEAAAVPPQNLAAAVPPPAPVTPEPGASTTPTPPPSIAAPAPTPTEIAKRPVFVDVRIDSTPAGATVMLVDRGKQTFLGTTPISTAVDPSRRYDIVFAYPNRQTQVEHLDPTATSRLSVVLGKPGNRAQAELARPVAVAKVATASIARPAKVAKPATLAEPIWNEPAAPPAKVEATTPVKVEAAPAPKAEKAVGGNGVLMISSKPPCEIHVDGKPTGLMTPQRALPLSAGKHRITLVNAAEKIKKSISVEITANESTKVIQDLMK